MTKELQNIFENIDKELLSDDVKEQLATMVEENINQKVEQRLELELENALEKQDKQHADKLALVEKAIQAIDKDHVDKMKIVVEAINNDHITKLNYIKQKYEDVIKKTAIKHREQLVESVDRFLDEEIIAKRIPKIDIIEAAKNTYTQNVLAEARKVLGVSDSFIKENVKSALIDGKRQLDTLAKENAELKKHKLVAETHKLLMEKTQHLPAQAARYIREKLKNRTPQFIRENFSYVMDMFERDEKSQKRAALQPNKFNVDRNRVVGDIISENTESNVSNHEKPQNSIEDMYLEAMTFRK